MNILVTGGAGYIGSLAVKMLLDKGHEVIVIDNLSKGVKELIPENIKFYELDLSDDISKVFKENKIDAVIHFGAYKSVGESMTNAPKYSNNIRGTMNLLDNMVKHNVKKIIFSSSAAVYGMPKEEVMTEETSTSPINYYGYTKLAGENLLKWYNKIHGISYIALRYFNVAGNDFHDYIDPDAQNILPIVMEVIFGKREKLIVFGDDYNTPDGTCIRDYIHIYDLVHAHILALDSDYNGVINLGTSKGYSVKELISTVEEVIGKKFNYEIGARRKGDPAKLIASNELAKKILGWVPKRDFKDMIFSMYNVYKKKF